MATGANGLGVFAAVVGGVVALDTIGKQGTRIARLATQNQSKETANSLLRSQLSNHEATIKGLREQNVTLREQASQRDRAVSEVAADRDRTRAELAQKEVLLATANDQAKRDQAEIAELKAKLAAATAKQSA